MIQMAKYWKRIGMNSISDYTSHAIQDELDSIIDILRDELDLTGSKVVDRLIDVRDSIPCSCGSDNEK